MKQYRLVAKTVFGIYRTDWQDAKLITIKELYNMIDGLSTCGIEIYFEVR